MLIGIITLIMVVVLYIDYKRNRNILIIAMLLTAFVFIVFILMLYVGKLSTYRSFLQIENRLYMQLYHIKCTLPQLKMLLNGGIAVFYLLLMRISFVNSKDIMLSNKIKNSIYVFSTVALIFVLVFNSPQFLERLFISKNTTANIAFYRLIERSIKSCNYGIMIYFCTLPFLMRMIEYKMTTIMFKKNEIIVVIVSLLFIELLFIVFMCISPFKYFTFDLTHLFDMGAISFQYNELIYVYFPILYMIIYVIMIVAFIKYGILDYVAIFRRFFLIRRTHISVNDIRHIFHSYKNCMFSVCVLANKVKENYGTEVGLAAVDKLINNAQEFSEHAGYFLDAYNKRYAEYEMIDIAACIDSAIGKIMDMTKDIKINKYYTSMYTYGDKHQITEMCYNILQNSVNAIEDKDMPGGCIDIRGFDDKRWLCISFYDNGCGMDKKTRKNMFKISYTKRKTFKNWGIGLSHVFNIVEVHRGFINVDSTEDKYTEMQIFLPKKQKKSRR